MFSELVLHALLFIYLFNDLIYSENTNGLLAPCANNQKYSTLNIVLLNALHTYILNYLFTYNSYK